MLHDPMTPHPFSRIVAILGRGKTKQRHLTFDEALEAMHMILDGDVLPEQIGAFLMLLRLKEESPDEIAGFAQATRDRLKLPATVPQVDLDWSSYAGKRIQLPWFVLSVMVLVAQGTRVVMHGTEGHTAGRLYTREVIELLESLQREEGVTLIVVTHDPELGRRAARRIRIVDGGVAADERGAGDAARA